MSMEEEYLDNLLKSIGAPQTDEADNEPMLEEEMLSEAARLLTEAAAPDMELNIDDLAVEEESTAPDVELDISDLAVEEETAAPDMELNIDDLAEEESAAPDMELDISDLAVEEETAAPDMELDIGDLAVEEESAAPDMELNIDDLIAEEEAAEPLSDEPLEIAEESNNIEEAAPEEESELHIDEAESDELGIDDIMNIDEELGDEGLSEELDLEALAAEDDLNLLDGIKINDNDDADADLDDGLDEVLSMLDEDAELAEINDILKNNDNDEPVQDEMMDLLNQMADDEEAKVNAGAESADEDDGGAAVPDMPLSKEDSADDGEDKPDKASKKKRKKKKAEADEAEKTPGALGKFFNMMTDELPGPTEADYIAEAEAKKAKKQEERTKKQEEKAAQAEAKAAKAEEKKAAQKAKADAARQEKKAKAEAKAAKKKAKQEAERANRQKKIPRKKILASAAFGASVLGGIVVATNVLANQGYINTARKAFYGEDYKSVYLATYGMDLDGSDELIRAKSEVIYKMQRWYDSYQNYLKLGQEREALNALLKGIESYDYINADAEEYGVSDEVESIKNEILAVLSVKYGVSEAQARTLLDYEDALSYTIALNDIITGK